MRFRTSAHAGEAAGPQSVWGAVRDLRVDRVGHRTRASEDPSLVDYMAEYRVPVELCILSNLRTGAVSEVEQHPVRRFFDCGIPLSINTDDSKLFGNCLVDGYVTLMQLGFSRCEIQTLLEQTISNSWMPCRGKQDLLADVHQECMQLLSDDS